MHQQSGWTATPSRLIGAHISAIPTIFMPDALPGTTLPIYPGLGQVPNMLTCIPVLFRRLEVPEIAFGTN